MPKKMLKRLKSIRSFEDTIKILEIPKDKRDGDIDDLLSDMLLSSAGP